MEGNLVNLDSFIGHRLLFVGVGNILRSDDGIGVYIVSRIAANKMIATLNVEVSLENYISTINKIAPEILILIDCMDFKEKPGTFKLFPIGEIPDDGIHSHHITLSKISEFFKMPVYVLGIQPEDLKVGLELNESIKAAANKIVTIINAQYSLSDAMFAAKPI